MDKQEIDREIKRIESGHIDKATQTAYRVVLSVPAVGPFFSEIEAVEKVQKFWGSKSGRMATYVRRLARNKVFRYGPSTQKSGKYLDPEIYSDGMGIVMGATIAQGYIKRAK